MPSFDSPEPIMATIELTVGAIHVAASERADTAVEVRASDPERQADIEAAAETRVNCSNGWLSVKSPRRHSLFSRSGSVEVSVALPSGSRLIANTASGGIRTQGRLGETRIRTAFGDVHLDETGPLRLDTAKGDVTVQAVTGHAQVTTQSGEVRIQRIDGTGTISSSNGDIWVGEITGDARLHSAKGTLTVVQARSTVVGKTARGDIHLDEVSRGTVAIETAAGTLDVGVREGTLAWLDLNTSAGQVRSELPDATSGPNPGEATVKIRANTAYGDVVIRRSTVDA
jgi:DUF4097 and DUF4098 domain-containing protein YvlB